MSNRSARGPARGRRPLSPLVPIARPAGGPASSAAGGSKVGILVEGRPLERRAILGIGWVAILGKGGSSEIEPLLGRLLDRLERWLTADRDEVLRALRDRDALLGRPVGWEGGAGRGAGIDEDGRLLVAVGDATVALHAGEVHLCG